MEPKFVLAQLRSKSGLSQDQLAERVFVTRQAVSRWERGEVLPSSDMLRRLSELFDVSINTLLGSPRQLICQSCGMPMQEEQYGTNRDGSKNHTYCCYCYKDGAFAQDCSLEEMIDFCAAFEVEGGRAKTVEEAKAMLGEYFPTLERWRV